MAVLLSNTSPQLPPSDCFTHRQLPFSEVEHDGSCYPVDLFVAWPLRLSLELLLAAEAGTRSLVSECELVALLLMHVGGPRYGWREPSG